MASESEQEPSNRPTSITFLRTCCLPRTIKSPDQHYILADVLPAKSCAVSCGLKALSAPVCQNIV